MTYFDAGYFDPGYFDALALPGVLLPKGLRASVALSPKRAASVRVRDVSATVRVRPKRRAEVTTP